MDARIVARGRRRESSSCDGAANQALGDAHATLMVNRSCWLMWMSLDPELNRRHEDFSPLLYRQ